MPTITQSHNLREICRYIFWGLLTTLVNFTAYFLFRTGNIITVQIAAALAWFVSVLFAFITNKFFVFRSSGTSQSLFFIEGSMFFVSRIFSGILDIALMTLAVNYALLPEKTAKLAVNVIIIVVNYLASKIFIFKRKR